MRKILLIALIALGCIAVIGLVVLIGTRMVAAEKPPKIAPHAGMIKIQKTPSSPPPSSRSGFATIGKISLEDDINGCKVHVAITPKLSGVPNTIEVHFLFRDAEGFVLHDMRWFVRRPVAYQTEQIKGWWHNHTCSDFDNVEITARRYR
jgi:hypothetical protein